MVHLTNYKDYWNKDNLIKRRNPWHSVVKAYTIPKISLLKKFIEINNQSKILDIGCGNGFFLYYFQKDFNCYGIDLSKKMLALNPVKKRICFMDANNLGFKDNSFDIVFCANLLHHINNLDNVINEMKRVSKKYIIIIEPNRNNPLMFLFCLLVKEERKALNFSLKFLKEILIKNDLNIIYATSTGLITPNKTPQILIPLLKFFDFDFYFGITNILIAKKEIL